MLPDGPTLRVTTSNPNIFSLRGVSTCGLKKDPRPVGVEGRDDFASIKLSWAETHTVTYHTG